MRSAAETAGYVIFRPGFSGSVTVVPAQLEYTIGAEVYRDAYDVDCAWNEGAGKPACWTIPNPD